jgi:hypothetical protein
MLSLDLREIGRRVGGTYIDYGPLRQRGGDD